MRIIEIVAQDNGAHRNQNGGLSVVHSGWAVIPADMECENFPFGEVEVEEVNGVMTVTKWTPGVMPEPEPEPEPEASIDERVTALEDAIATGLTLYEEDLGNG